jgi:hypothetical protein
MSVPPSQGRAKSRRPRRGHDGPGDERQLVVAERDVRAARGPDHRHLGLVVELLGPQAVGPHARGVDDVVGADGEALAAQVVDDLDALRPAALLEQPGDLDAVAADRAEALGLLQAR